jgi:hypothetical protein
MGGKFHLKLNRGGSPIAYKYREGKVQRTLKRELKELEIAHREAVAASACRGSDHAGGGSWPRAGRGPVAPPARGVGLPPAALWLAAHQRRLGAGQDGGRGVTGFAQGEPSPRNPAARRGTHTVEGGASGLGQPVARPLAGGGQLAVPRPLGGAAAGASRPPWRR